MSDQQHPIQECPSASQLSSWYDGEEEADLSEHIASCPRCRGILESYRRMDEAVRVASRCPDGLAGRIKTACRESGREAAEPDVLSFPAVWYAAAGIAAILLVGAFLAMPLAGDHAQESRVAKNPVPEVSPPVSTPSRKADAVKSPSREEKVAKNSHDPINSSSLVMVDSSGRPGNSRSPVIIPPRVRHVWVVHDLELCQKKLLQSLPQGCASQRVGHGDGAVQYEILIPDGKLQALVDELAGEGWSLVSPGVPQPGVARKVVEQGITVRYDVELVGKH